MKRTITSITAALFLAAGLTACGGDDDEEDRADRFDKDCRAAQGVVTTEGEGDDHICTFPDGRTTELDIDSDEHKSSHKKKRHHKPKARSHR